MARAKRHFIPGYIWHTPVKYAPHLFGLGMEEFVEWTKEELRIRARGRKIREMEGQFELRESEAPYNGHFEAKKSYIRPENGYIWKDYPRILG